MSTKTTLKRIALVAVSALGFGLMSLIPSNAALLSPTAITLGSTSGFRVGVTNNQDVTFTLPSGAANNDTIIVLARVTSAPADSFSTSKAAVPTRAAISSSTPAAADISWAAAAQGSGFYGTPTSVTRSTGGDGLNSSNDNGVQNWTAVTAYPLNASDSKTSFTLRFQFRPDAAGSYTVLYAVGRVSANNLYDTEAEMLAAETSALVANTTTVTGTITSAGTPTTATLAAVTTGAPVTGSALYRVTLDSGLASTETLALSSNSSTVTFRDHAGNALTNNTISGDGSTTYYFQVRNSVAETATVTVTGGGLLSSAITATANVTHTAVTATLTTQPSFSVVTGSTTMARVSATAYDASSAATSQALTVTGTAAQVVRVQVTDTFGKATGKANAVYDRVVTIGSAGTSTFSVTATLLVGQTINYTLTSTSTGDTNVTITGRAATATTITVANDTRRTALLGSTTFTAEVDDQFGAPMANQVVNVSVTGRNATTASVAYTSNADGLVSHTVTDAGTTGLSDVVTFTVSGTTVSDTGTILYGSATATTVLVTTPNTTSTGVDEYPLDPEDIAAGTAGAAAGAVTVTANVKDAAGAVMAGMPVTWTISGDGCAITSTSRTGFTNASGDDTASVYGWKNGTCTVTATSGGQSDSAPVIFAQETPTEARTIEATVSGNRITATVKDRYGNVITAATPVVATVTAGTGYFGSATSATANTNENGQVTFVVTGGAATVKVGFETSIYGQSDALKGLVDGTTATNIFTATTTGTSTTDETGVGASFDAAGVNSVTVSTTASDSASTAAEAASDAALEAIDAANAATDAANLAAEAADAATVAAEEARDAADAATAAVEALASEVATLIAGLKAQITTLANTVAKIAKRVRA